MLAATASAALIAGASLALGGSISILGRRDPSPLDAALGLAALIAIAGVVVALGGRATALAVVLGVIAIGAVALVATRRVGVAAAPLAAAALAALFAAIPFLAAGNVGILGVGLVNDDMASHLLLADWLREGFRPEPVLVDQGYPLGPHALVAGLGELLGASSIDVFAGLTLAIPAVTALVAFAALEGVATGWRIAASALVALPYMAAAYLAQEAFKEPLIAVFLLAFALLLPSVREWRDALGLGVLCAGAVYVYSFPGLAWFAGVALIWVAIGLWRRRRLAGAERIAIAVALALTALLCIPELDRLRDFADFRALDPERANEGGLGNLPGQLSPLEALGIWPTSEFRLAAGSGSLPAVVFYAGALLAALALVLALPRWTLRHGFSVPAALLTAAALYLAARAFGTVYTSAKALAIAAPLIALIALGGLLISGPLERVRRWLAAAFALAAAFSSLLILRQAPVGPEAHAAELAEVRQEVAGSKLLFLGRDNFILHELRGSKPFTHVRNFYDPYFVEPNFKLTKVGSKFDFDSVTAKTLARFPYVLTTRAAYASSPPPGYDPVIERDSYVLWQRAGPVDGRRPAENGPAPGRVGGCEGKAKRVATFTESPVLGRESAWSATTISGGEPARIELELAPGVWNLSLRYDASRSLRVSAPGLGETLPANLDYRGTASFWPAGTIDVRGRSPVEITAEVADPPLIGRLLGADSVAHLGELAATPAGGNRVGSRCRGYVDWYVR